MSPTYSNLDAVRTNQQAPDYSKIFGTENIPKSQIPEPPHNSWKIPPSGKDSVKISSKNKYTGTAIGASIAAILSFPYLGAFNKFSTGAKAFAFAFSLFTAPGVIVDLFNNRQRAKNEPDTTTKNGNEYKKVNMGKKLGALLGLAVECINSIKIKKFSALVAGIDMLAGFTLGALADSIANKLTAREADKAK